MLKSPTIDVRTEKVYKEILYILKEIKEIKESKNSWKFILISS